MAGGEPSDAWTIIGSLLTFVFIIVFVVPIQGVVARFRINYTPKGVGLGDLAEEGDQQTLSQDMRVGPVVNSIWAMIGRVKRIEGYSGFFKGLMPFLLIGFSNVAGGVVILGSGSSRHRINAGGPISTVIWALTATILAIPGEILLNRAVTTPHKLSWWNIRTSLRALFTPYERRKPWVLFFTPGLALAQTIHVLYFLAIARGVRSLLLPSYDPSKGGFPILDGFLPFIGLLIYALFLSLSFVVLTPLEVLAARLSVQRNHEAGTVTGASNAEDLGLEYAGAEEDVIALRDEDTPYLGLQDAYQRMVSEEGWSTLYRCWWLSLLAAVVGGFA